MGEVASLHAATPWEPTTQASALTGNPTSDFSLCGLTSNHPSHTGQGQVHLFNKPLLSVYHGPGAATALKMWWAGRNPLPGELMF